MVIKHTCLHFHLFKFVANVQTKIVIREVDKCPGVHWITSAVTGFLTVLFVKKGYDDTWECTDRKDHLGNIIEEQGAFNLGLWWWWWVRFFASRSVFCVCFLVVYIPLQRFTEQCYRFLLYVEFHIVLNYLQGAKNLKHAPSKKQKIVVYHPTPLKLNV